MNSTYTFEQIEAVTAILREYGSAIGEEYEDGHEVYELDYVRRIAEALEPRKATR